MEEVQITIDNEALLRYNEYYFVMHPRARKWPIPHPWHESINQWMIMRRPQMNALKQKWKDFIIWLVGDLGLTNKHISQCELWFHAYYPTKRRHDIDNSTPKFILDGLVESGLIEDDDILHVTKLVLECSIDKERPRTEIKIICLAE